MNNLIIALISLCTFPFLSVSPSRCGPHTDDEYCNGISKNVNNGPEVEHGKRKYTKKATWEKYEALITNALDAYQPCEATDCGCYNEVIKRDLAPFADGISKTMLDSIGDWAIKYQMIDHKLYRTEKCMFSPRCEGVEHFLHLVIGYLPDMEFYINPRDFPLVNKRAGLKPIFSFSKVVSESHDIMYPAWSFWGGGPSIKLYPTGIGRWDLRREEIHQAAAQLPWQSKDKRAFFRGSRTSAERDPLVLLSREMPRLVDAKYTKNQAWKSEKDTLGEPPAELTNFNDHCKYRYLFNFRGIAASFRLKHLFLCNSLVFHVGDEWQEFFYDQLIPWVHYVPVDTDLANVQDLLSFFNEHQDLAQEIAQRGRDFIWNHLRQADVTCYWRRLLRKYAALLDFEVTKDESLVRRTNDMIKQK